jgi:hypothetical protein
MSNVFTISESILNEAKEDDLELEDSEKDEKPDSKSGKKKTKTKKDPKDDEDDEQEDGNEEPEAEGDDTESDGEEGIYGDIADDAGDISSDDDDDFSLTPEQDDDNDDDGPPPMEEESEDEPSMDDNPDEGSDENPPADEETSNEPEEDENKIVKVTVLDLSPLERAMADRSMYRSFSELFQKTVSLKTSLNNYKVRIDAELLSKIEADLVKYYSLLEDYLDYKFSIYSYEENQKNFLIFSSAIDQIIENIDSAMSE